MSRSLISALLVLATWLCGGSAAAAPTTFIFHGDIVAGSGNLPNCPGLCGYNVPPAGNPISFVVTLDAHLPPFSGSTPAGTDTLYDMSGLSSVDFGYRSAFRFTDFQVRVIDDNTFSSMPDQLLIYRTQPNLSNSPDGGAWFSLELLSSSVDLLAGPDLPTSLELSRAAVARGSLSFSTNGQTSENAEFVITSVELVTPVPEPATIFLASFALLGLGLTLTSRRSTRLWGASQS